MARNNSAPASNENSLSELVSKVSGNKLGGLDYAGEVTPEDAFAFISNNDAILIDVRTTPEWQFTGVPDISATRAKLATISWKNYPDFSGNQKFAAQIAEIPGIGKDAALFFICRSGGRSLDAAVAMTAGGYNYCFNVSGGFEGDPDANGHRGISQGWKAKKLPWKQG